MTYFDWHQQPGYWGDVTRHFPSSTALLDLGCGTGWLADHFPDYTGLDGSAEAVAIAKARGRNALQGDLARPLPFADASFAGVVLKDVLEHVADPARVVREVCRVLAPGGRAFASSPDAQRWVWDDYTHVRPFTRRSFRLLFSDQGLEIDGDGYESVMPGIGIISGLLPAKRRPLPLNLLARTRLVRRNVWLLARRPDDHLWAGHA